MQLRPLSKMRDWMVTGESQKASLVGEPYNEVPDRVEARHGLDSEGQTIPERVKTIRRTAVQGLLSLEPEDPARRQFEEDILGLKTATMRGTRKAMVRFGQPISVSAEKGARTTPTELTRLLEERVQWLLVEDLVLRMLAKRPEDRHQTPRELIKDLIRVDRHHGVEVWLS